jgi:hypothetical protein
LKQLDSAEKTSGFAREISKTSETETVIAEIEVDEDVVVAEAVVSTVDLPEITPGRSRHHRGSPMVRVIFIATEPCPEKQTRTFLQGRVMGEGVGDDSAPLLSLAVVPVQLHLAAHLLPDREELHAAIHPANAAAVVLQSIGTPNDLPNPKEVNADAAIHHPTREDAHHLQSVDETRALLPSQDAIAHVHHLELDSMAEMAGLACPHHAVDVPLHSPKTDRQSVLMLSRIVTPLTYADPIAAVVDNVLEAAPEMPVDVRHLWVEHVRANDTRPRDMMYHPRKATTIVERAVPVLQRRWVLILNVSRQFVQAHTSLVSVLLCTHRIRARSNV